MTGERKKGSLLDEVVFTKSDGSLHFRDVRYLLVRPETLMAVYRETEKRFGKEVCSEVFFRGGFRGGKLSSDKFRGSSPSWEREIVDFMANMGCEIGWGKFTVKELDLSKKRLILTIASSAFAEAFGKSGHPVCDLPRGVFAGVAAGIFGSGIEAVEKQCAAEGSSVCRIEIQGKE